MAKDKQPEKISVFKTSKPKNPNAHILTPILAVGGYFKDSWRELKQVRWPNRRNTWAMTAAVILFTGLALILIITLDYIFNELFKLLIK